MSTDGDVGPRDAAEVGLGLVFPDGLISAMDRLAADRAPVDVAVSTGWAGLGTLRVITAELNGSVAAARQSGAGPAVGGSSSESRVVNDPESASARNGWTIRQEEHRRLADGLGPMSAEAASIRAVEDERIGAKGEASGRVLGFTVRTGAAPLKGSGREDGQSPGVQGTAARIEDLTASVAPIEDGRYASGGSGTGSTDRDVAVAIEQTAAPLPVAPRGLRADVRSALQDRAAPAMTVPVYEGTAAARYAGEKGTEIGEAFDIDRRRGSAPGFGAGSIYESEAGGAPGSAAPQAADRGGEAGAQISGEVRLDGHMVGYWLMERMARAAARPGAGTTSFDARQAPAWTPSGAL